MSPDATDITDISIPIDPYEKADESVSALVLEDEQDAGRVYAICLEALGFVVTTVQGGESASRLLREQRFDLAVFDCIMSGKNGIDVLDEIRKGSGPNNKTPVILVSGHSSMEKESLIHALGADLFLQKPVDVEELQKAAYSFMRSEQRAILAQSSSSWKFDLHGF